MVVFAFFASPKKMLTEVDEVLIDMPVLISMWGISWRSKLKRIALLYSAPGYRFGLAPN